MTEFRHRNTCLSVREIRDEYKTPLSIVAEKRKKIKFKVKEKQDGADKADDNDLSKFKLGAFGTFSLEPAGSVDQPQSQS